MCGRFNLRTPAAQLAAFFDIVFDPPLQAALAPRFNIAPSQPVLIVRGQAGRNAATLVCWGLVPGWAKDPAIGNRMINARGETVAEKPSFRAAFRHRRCLVPATGFYEWQRIGGQHKQPWHIHHPDNRPLAFAGIWENWEGPDGSSLQTCAIITTEANSRMAPIHHRMPVILRPDDFATWLDPRSDHHDQLESLLVPCPDETLVTSPIDTWVNRPANEGPDCLRPASNPTTTDGRLFE
jgi:putative SOS response-associated peptidase YedK